MFTIVFIVLFAVYLCRMDVQVDRLSSLSDDLIHLIPSFLDSTKDAIQTMALSTRYRFIWTSLQFLKFSDEDFLRLRKYNKFENRVLSGRDTQIEVYSVKLSLSRKVGYKFLKRILNYAFTQTVTYLGDMRDQYKGGYDFPLSLFNSQSLKYFTLCGSGLEVH